MIELNLTVEEPEVVATIERVTVSADKSLVVVQHVTGGRYTVTTAGGMKTEGHGLDYVAAMKLATEIVSASARRNRVLDAASKAIVELNGAAS